MIKVSFILFVVFLFGLLYFYIKPFSNEEELIVSLVSYSKDKSRFIAHAGGEIDGHKYTNSLEALDYSYNQGFRLFELDIIKTLDDSYVAAHDWGKWKRITKYTGDIPPNKDEFLQQKIFNKYTPMDMRIINQWFSENNDAILVTDKVNLPSDFSKKFVDKNRLMMELFSWEQVLNGLQAKILSAMPTGNLLKKITGDKVKYLKGLGIKHVAMSQNLLITEEQLIIDIQKAGIKIYAFHINAKKKKGEKYITCNKRKYFHGIYANTWDFDLIPNCGL